MKIEEGTIDTAGFWASVSAPTEAGCMEWSKSLMANGYGQLRRKGKHYTAHRVAYTLMYGSIPQGLCVCHHCDNRRCCNPAHLFLGTHQDNHDDMIAKGRKRWVARKGSSQGSAKLTEAQVAEIKTALTSGNRVGRVLAAKYGVSPSAISIIKRNKGWTHV